MRDARCDMRHQLIQINGLFWHPPSMNLLQPDQVMKSFFCRHAQRKVAAAMVSVWLFATASGLVNACQLEAPDSHFHAARAEQAEHQHGIAPAANAIAVAGQAHVDEDHDRDSKNFKAPCLKVCDDSSRSVIKQSVCVDHIDPGSAPLIAVLWLEPMPMQSSLGGRYGALRVPPDVLPVRVLYSRLTL